MKLRVARKLVRRFLDRCWYGPYDPYTVNQLRRARRLIRRRRYRWLRSRGELGHRG